jgi:F0F1-type ATP synthase delta subunit
MMQSLFTSYIQDLLLFLKQEKGFFQQDADKRQSSAQKHFGFSSVAEYLSKASEASFVDDLKDALKLLKENPDVEKKHLAESFARYFLDEFPKAFDQLNASFYRSSEAHQKSKLLELFQGNTTFFRQLRDILHVNSVQETSEDIVAFLKELFDSPRIIVQSPLECDEKTKAEVRAHFHAQYPKSFVVFHVNSQLIGGIRFFVDGKVNDHSWFSKVQAIQQLSVKL